MSKVHALCKGLPPILGASIRFQELPMMKSTGLAYAPMGADGRQKQAGVLKQEDTAICIDTSFRMDSSKDNPLGSGLDTWTSPIDLSEKQMRIAYAPGKNDYRQVWRTSLDGARSACIPVSMASLCLTHLTLVVTHLTGCANTPKEEDRHSGVLQTGLT
ncbi:MAG: hypothetical protein Q7U75_20035, partial [Desulfobacterales bacterium]|nr:hypothetical protein [Desulfobacterales bacterium]